MKQIIDYIQSKVFLFYDDSLELVLHFHEMQITGYELTLKRDSSTICLTYFYHNRWLNDQLYSKTIRNLVNGNYFVLRNFH